MAGFVAEKDAFQVRRIKEAGALVLAKSNMAEFAFSPYETVNSILPGYTKNPYKLDRVTAGSSGGTAAAVAASFAAAGMGTDTCGSIRLPAAHNNLFGLRGTMGLSSRDGIIPLALSQDIGGPLARSVTDLALLLDATVGFDSADPVTAASEGRIPRTYLAAVGDSDLGNESVGVLTPLFGSAPEDEEVAVIVRKAIAAIHQLGAAMANAEIAGFDDLLQDTSVINAEFKFDLMDYLRARPNAPVRSLADILKRQLHHEAVNGVFTRAEAVPSRDTEAYRTALAKRDAAREAVLAAMGRGGFTVLAYPTIRRKPAPIGQPQPGNNCQLSAATGLPAISIPAGFTADGLPVGLELLGQPFSEARLLRIAYAYERMMQPRRPPFSGF
jgi:Asp-tRNA(Asn)/Glu-tRNA(Gln) amidotransferase A subunit family amidase